MRHNIGKLSWGITDNYGWPVNKKNLRNSIISDILDEEVKFDSSLVGDYIIYNIRFKF